LNRLSKRLGVGTSRIPVVMESDGDQETGVRKQGSGDR
jgi:hypothetical protein